MLMRRTAKMLATPFPFKGAARSTTALVAGAITLSACGPDTRAMDDNAKIVKATLSLLSSDGKPVCVDDATQDRPLVIFREMTAAPRPSRRPLRWYPPRPLRPEPITQTDGGTDDAIRNADIKLAEPSARLDPLPGLEQLQLRTAAWRLSTPVGDAEQPTDIRTAWLPKGVSARWWPLNRLRKDCDPRFIISHPVRGKDFAFIAVRADHWGTLYALKPEGSDWKPVAEWSRWLY